MLLIFIFLYYLLLLDSASCADKCCIILFKNEDKEIDLTYESTGLPPKLDVISGGEKGDVLKFFTCNKPVSCNETKTNTSTKTPVAIWEKSDKSCYYLGNPDQDCELSYNVTSETSLYKIFSQEDAKSQDDDVSIEIICDPKSSKSSFCDYYDDKGYECSWYTKYGCKKKIPPKPTDNDNEAMNVISFVVFGSVCVTFVIGLCGVAFNWVYCLFGRMDSEEDDGWGDQVEYDIHGDKKSGEGEGEEDEEEQELLKGKYLQNQPFDDEKEEEGEEEVIVDLGISDGDESEEDESDDDMKKVLEEQPPIEEEEVEVNPHQVEGNPYGIQGDLKVPLGVLDEVKNGRVESSSTNETEHN